MGQFVDSYLSRDTLHSDKCFVMILDCYLKLVSPVVTATRYWLNGLGIYSWWGTRFAAPFLTSPGSHPASYTTGTGYFPGVKRPWRGDDHPPHIAPMLKKE